MKTTLLNNDFELLNNDFERDIKGVVACDLLSLVMSEGKENNVFITVLGNLNSVAVASLHDFSAIIISYNQKVGDEVISKATENEIAIYKTPLSTSKVVEKLLELGIS